MLCLFFRKKMDTTSCLNVYTTFENMENIHENDFNKLINYICGNLVCRSPNRIFWKEKDEEAMNLYRVIKWRKSKGLKPHARRGGKDSDGKLTFFFLDELCSARV